MPSQGHNYSPFPPAIPAMPAMPEIPPIPANSAASNASTSGTFATAPMTDQAQYYPYYPSPTQYQSQVYSQQYQQYPFQGYQYYQQPISSTNYAQAYIDATYSASFQQVAPPSNSQNLNYQRSNQNSWKKNQRLPVAYCNDCSRPFYSNLDYQNHLKCHVDCPECGLTLTKKQLVSHRNDAHPKLVTLENPKDIANYIAERKGKFPISGNDQAKIEQDQSKSISWKDPDQEKDQNTSKKRKLVVSVGYCKFFPLGKCKKGADCPYYHEIPTEQEEKKAALQSTVNLEQKKKSKKQKKKLMDVSKIKTTDRSKLFQLLNEEFMTKDDSILLQVIRYVMDNSKTS